LVFVNYCPKVHKPHFCSHNLGENSLGEKGENKGKKDTYSPIPQGDSPENSPNSPNSLGDSPIPRGENSPKGEIPSLVAIPQRGKRIRKIPQRGKLGEKTSHENEENKPKDSRSDLWGILAILGAGSLLAFLLYRGWSQRSSNNDSGSISNNSSPPPSTSGSNPYDFGAGDFGVKSLDELTRYDV
jgi:hypothetical protein